MSARDDYPDLGTLRDAYIDGAVQYGGSDAYAALIEIDQLRDELNDLRVDMLDNNLADREYVVAILAYRLMMIRRGSPSMSGPSMRDYREADAMYDEIVSAGVSTRKDESATGDAVLPADPDAVPTPPIQLFDGPPRSRVTHGLPDTDLNPFRHDHNPLNADFHGGSCPACDWWEDHQGDIKEPSSPPPTEGDGS